MSDKPVRRQRARNRAEVRGRGHGAGDRYGRVASGYTPGVDAFEHALLVAAALVTAALLSMRGKWGVALSGHRQRRPLSPGAQIQVSSDAVGIVCAYPDGRVMKLAWPEITAVRIQTTSGGPLLPDVFWQVQGVEGSPSVSFPSGATGEQVVVEALAARLPGFDHRTLVAAMACATDRTFTVWQKTAER